MKVVLLKRFLLKFEYLLKNKIFLNVFFAYQVEMKYLRSTIVKIYSTNDGLL